MLPLFRDATGNSGNVTVTTDNLSISEGAQIAVSTFSSGTAGNLKITASKSIGLTGNAIEVGGGSSGLFSSAVGGDGSGGNIDLTTKALSIKDGATISASNFLSSNAAAPPGTGQAGNININANTIALDGIEADTPASITAATFAGGGGNIAITSETLTAENGSQITAETVGEGAGGSIAVTTKDVNIQTGAVVSSSNTAAGNAGTISFTSESLNITTEGNITTSSTGTGQAGDINLNSDRLTTNRGLITATSQQSGGGDINLATESINLQNNSLISTSVSDSNGGGGDITIDNSNLILTRNNSDIRANADLGPGGNINITTELIFTDLTSDIDASSKRGIDGVVEIKSPESDKELNTAILPENIEDPTGLITASCPISNENNFAVTGNGGIPNSPYQTQTISSVWHDLRPVNEEKVTKATTPAPRKEAIATIINADGELELVALTPMSTHRWVKSSCSSSIINQ